MKRISNLSVLILLTIAFLLTNCIGYNFANFNAEPIPFVSLASTKSNDSTRISTSVGGKYIFSTNNAYNHLGESTKSGLVYLYQSRTKKNSFTNYGLYGYAGDYLVNYLNYSNKSESYYGLGLSVETGLNIPIFNFLDWHFVGVRGTVFYENGKFTEFRKSLIDYTNNNPNTYSTTYGFNYSMTTGINFHVCEFSCGIDGAFGTTFSPLLINFVPTINSNSYLTYKQLTFYYQTECSEQALGMEYSLGIIYRLK